MNHIRGEAIVSCGHRRMGREQASLTNLRLRLLSRRPVLHFAVEELDGEKSGMTLVHVVRGRLNVLRLEEAPPSDAEQNLLTNSCVDVAAVHMIRQALEMEVVIGNSRV